MSNKGKAFKPRDRVRVISERRKKYGECGVVQSLGSVKAFGRDAQVVIVVFKSKKFGPQNQMFYPKEIVRI